MMSDDDYDDDTTDFFMKQAPLFLSLAVISFISFLGMICGISCCSKKCFCTYLLSLFGMLTFMIGSSILFAYGKHRNFEMNFNYYGPMKITSVQIQPILIRHACDKEDWKEICTAKELDRNSCSQCESIVHVPHVTVEWGDDDGVCPTTTTTTTTTMTITTTMEDGNGEDSDGHGEVQHCQSSTLSYTCGNVACTRNVLNKPSPNRPSLNCTEEEHSNASLIATACTKEHIFDPMINYTSYDHPNEFPGVSSSSSSSSSSTPTWPTIDRFGDCTTCQVRKNLPSETLIHRLYVYGLVLTLLGIILVLGPVIICYVKSGRGGSNNPTVMLNRMARDGSQLRYGTKDQQKDLHYVMTAIRQNGTAIQYADSTIRHRYDVGTIALQQTTYAFPYVSLTLRDTKDVVLQVVQQYGWLLQYATPRLQDDRDVVLTAVRQNGQALKYASETLQGDRTVVLAAVQKSGTALEFASRALQDDDDDDPKKNVVWVAIHTSGQSILQTKYMSKRLQNDPNIRIMAKKRTLELKETTSSTMSFQNSSLFPRSSLGGEVTTVSSKKTVLEV